MKKVFYLFIAAMLCMGSMHVQAQVRIGSLTDPEPGALLDLNTREGDSSGKKGVLLLSDVELKNKEQIPNTFVNVPAPKDSDPELAGLLVYNVGSDLPQGLYYWDGEMWVALFTIRP